MAVKQQQTVVILYREQMSIHPWNRVILCESCYMKYPSEQKSFFIMFFNYVRPLLLPISFVSPATKEVGAYRGAYLFTFQHGCETKIDIGSWRWGSTWVTIFDFKSYNEEGFVDTKES